MVQKNQRLTIAKKVTFLLGISNPKKRGEGEGPQSLKLVLGNVEAPQ
jgi:hypothetical protein